MKDQIKSYLQRLNHGEALENVQADFVRECKDVDPPVAAPVRPA